MGRHKRKQAKREAVPVPNGTSESDSSIYSLLPMTDPEFLSALMVDNPEFSILDKISKLLSSVTSHRHSEVQVIKETVSQAIKDIYTDSLTAFSSDMHHIRSGDLFFTEKVMLEDFQMLKVALSHLLQIDDSKEVYHLTFVQVNWFTDQLIRSIRSLEGCSSSTIMAAVTRAWNVTKAAAQRLNTFLFHLFKSDRSDNDFSCMILNKQILIEKLRKEPIIMALNQNTEAIGEEDECDSDVYEGKSIEEIATDIEESKSKKKKRHQAEEADRLCEEFRCRLEREPTPTNKVVAKCSQKWLEGVWLEVMEKYRGAFGDLAGT